MVIHYTGVLNFDQDTTNIFINANLVKFYDKNPFKAAVRKLPIEFSYKSEETYHMSIVLPENIQPDSLYQPIQISYENEDMHYINNVGYYPSIHTLVVNTDFAINTTTYSIPHYETIREFFQKIVDENNKVIVLKKSINK